MKGAGVKEIGQPFAILGGFAVVVLTVAVRQYHKRTA
jgi:hypothetical protein